MFGCFAISVNDFSHRFKNGALHPSRCFKNYSAVIVCLLTFEFKSRCVRADDQAWMPRKIYHHNVEYFSADEEEVTQAIHSILILS